MGEPRTPRRSTMHCSEIRRSGDSGAAKVMVFPLLCAPQRPRLTSRLPSHLWKQPIERVSWEACHSRETRFAESGGGTYPFRQIQLF